VTVEPYYQDESVTLYHGDCLESMASMDSASFDLIFTSPPYNLGVGGHFPKPNGRRGLWDGGALRDGYADHRSANQRGRRKVTYEVLDIENVGEPHEGRLICVGLGDRAYVPNGPGWQDCLDRLANPDIGKIVFTKHDHRYLLLAGYEVNGPIVDAQAMAWVVDERTDLDLATLSQLYVPHTVKRSRIKSKAGVIVFECDNGEWLPLEDAPIDEVCAYNVQDLKSTEALALELKRIIRFEGLADYYEHDVLPFTEVLVKAEVRGLPIDLPQTVTLRERLEEEADYYEYRLRAEGGLPEEFNLNSATQLSAYLYNRTYTFERRVEVSKEERGALKARLASGETVELAGMTLEKVGTKYATGSASLPGLGLSTETETDRGQKSTSAKVLRVEQEHPWVDLLLERAKRVTVAGYLAGFEKRTVAGRVYGRFNQTGTKTGRLSSSSPNLQNVPARGDLGRACRELFRPEPGTGFLHGDYGQLEPRLMAHFSCDPALVSIFDEKDDIYLRTAVMLWGDTLPEGARNVCKVLVLALGYGSGAETLHRQLAEAGFRFPLHEVETMLARLKGVYARLFEWKEDVIATAANEGYVETLAGHRRRFSKRHERHRGESWRQQAADERQAVNAVIQGSAADIVGRTMMAVDREYGEELRLLAQVHDELLLEYDVNPELDPICYVYRLQWLAESGHGFKLRVPLEFIPKVVPTWAEGKD